jgi:hypothetical protein
MERDLQQKYQAFRTFKTSNQATGLCKQSLVPSRTSVSKTTERPSRSISEARAMPNTSNELNINKNNSSAQFHAQ